MSDGRVRGKLSAQHLDSMIGTNSAFSNRTQRGRHDRGAYKLLESSDRRRNDFYLPAPFRQQRRELRCVSFRLVFITAGSGQMNYIIQRRLLRIMRDELHICKREV